MKFKKLVSAAVMSCALASGAAFATPFTMNLNSLDPDIGFLGTNGITHLIHQLGLNWSATSTFTDLDANGVDIGDAVVDVGSGGINAYLGAGAVALSGAEANEGLNVLYGINFSYNDLVGTVAFVDPLNPGGIVASYTSGTISVFMNGDPLQEILSLGVTGSAGTVGNLLLFADVLSVDTGIFRFNGVDDWALSPVVISARIDTNLDPVPPVSAGVDVLGRPLFARTATLDGSASFAVPEPGILALLGLGLVGIGAVRRMKKSA